MGNSVKKYKLLTDDTITIDGRMLYRIEALKDFGNVKKGQKGGYVESEDNLSHEGNCWVYGGAKVYNNAKVYDNAKVDGEACMHGKVVLRDCEVVSTCELYKIIEARVTE